MKGEAKIAFKKENHVKIEERNGSFKMFNSKNVFSVEFNKG